MLYGKVCKKGDRNIIWFLSSGEKSKNVNLLMV